MTNINIVRNSFKAWVLAARPKTLTGAAVPVMIGAAMAYRDVAQESGTEFCIISALLCFLFAFIMQIDANFINDYFDFLKGTDDPAKRLGPRRACAQGWVDVGSMRRAIAVTTVLACLTGAPLILFGGFEMVLIGLLSVLFCFLYTTHLSYKGAGDLLVLVFFGIIPVCITYYIQTKTITFDTFAASVACGLIIDTLLVVNNYRDIDTDREVGKNTLVVRLGAHRGRMLYLFLGILACGVNAVHCLYGNWCSFVLPLLFLPLHYQTYAAIRRIGKGKALNLCLGMTARNMFVYGVLASLSFLL